MNQNRLQQKRRKRQANRKEAQVRARRRNMHAEQTRANASAPYALPGRKPATVSPGFFSRLLGGTQVTPDQMDPAPAPIVGGS